MLPEHKRSTAYGQLSVCYCMKKALFFEKAVRIAALMLSDKAKVYNFIVLLTTEKKEKAF